MEQWEINAINERKTVPQPIVESSKGFTVHNAEVAFDGKHFVIQKGFGTREGAMACAKEQAEQLRTELFQHGNKLMSGFAVAKE